MVCIYNGILLSYKKEQSGEGGDICIPMADSCWYLTENNEKAILLQLKK